MSRKTNPVKLKIIRRNDEDVKILDVNERNKVYIKSVDAVNKKPKTDDQLFKKYKDLENKWVCEQWKNLTMKEIEQIGLKNFDLKLNDLHDVEKLSESYYKQIYEAVKLSLYFEKNNIDKQEYEQKFDKIFELIYYFNECLRNFSRIKLTMNPSYDTHMNNDKSILRFKSRDLTKLDSLQNLILYLLKKLWTLGYRRYGSNCYKQIIKDGHPTYAWKKIIAIDKFVYNAVDKETNWEQWVNLTSKDNAKKSIKYLENCFDVEFLELAKNRHVFSFKNGLYIAKNKNLNGEYYGKFCEYGKEIGGDYVSAKYFDSNFDNTHYDNWYDIPTPNLQKILDYQFKMEDDYEDICKWMYILLGRLLYDVKELDDWQVIPLLKGQAGTGKGTIIDHVVKHFYDSDDFGVLSNTIEKQFGLMNLYNKYVIIAPEVKENFQLSQTDFQSMVSGDMMSVAVKNKGTQQLMWTAPGIMASNTHIGYNDASGSITRRIIYFAFQRKVKKQDKDPMLYKKLIKEIPNIIQKCNRAYLDAANKWNKKDVWVVLPKYFEKTKDAIAVESNTLKYFLNSSSIVYGKELYCKRKVFVDAFNDFCKSMNYKLPKITEDLYNDSLNYAAEKHNIDIKMVKAKKMEYPKGSGRKTIGDFIIGLDIITDEDTNDDFAN